VVQTIFTVFLFFCAQRVVCVRCVMRLMFHVFILRCLSFFMPSFCFLQSGEAVYIGVMFGHCWDLVSSFVVLWVVDKLRE